MPLKIYINGQLYDKDDAKISVYDHGLLYGDGVFEGIRSYGGKVFRMAEHLQRLWDSAKVIWLEIPLSKKEIADAIEETLAVNGIKDGYIRVVVTRGVGSLGLDPNRCSNPQVIIIADKIALYPDELYQQGLEIVTVSVVRNHPAALSPRVKSLNYLNNILAKIEGIQAGCIEAMMLNHKGEVAECTGDNIFLVRQGRLLTPPNDAGILEGITRDAVIGLAGAAGRAGPRDSSDQVRRVHRRRVFSHRHGGRGGAGGQGRQPHDRRWRSGTDYPRTDGPFPRIDAKLVVRSFSRRARPPRGEACGTAALGCVE